MKIGFRAYPLKILVFSLVFLVSGISPVFAAWENQFDYNNRLIKVSEPSLGEIDYSYDPFGSRYLIEKSDGSKKTYASDYFNTDGKIDTRHIFANGKPIATVEFNNETGESKTFFNASDHLGSIGIVTDHEGKIAEQTEYRPFGIPTSESISGRAEQRKFTGHEFDLDTGYTYARNRYLDSNIGRFISQDPAFLGDLSDLLVDPQQLNSYSYTRNNPVKYVDPDGKRLIISNAYGENFINNTFSTLRQLNPNIHRIETDSGSEIKINFWHRFWSWFRKDEASLDLFKQVIDNERIVTIEETNGGDAASPDNHVNASNGIGSGGTIFFNDDPTHQITLGEFNEQTRTVTSGVIGKDVVLGHELIHQSHYLQGTRETDTLFYRGLNGEQYHDRREEVRTVGLCCNRYGDVTENDLRREKGLNPRNNY